jgi:predicted PurR-regulated permease PerM
VGLAQGSLTGIGFWAVGLPSPVLWGAVAAFTSLLPIVGTGLVWVPGAIVLVIGGHWMKALLLAAFGAAVVAQVDALIRPYVISGRANMNGLVIFFALLGGVQAFGAHGLVHQTGRGFGYDCCARPAQRDRCRSRRRRASGNS